MVPGVGPHTSRALLERFGTRRRVLDASVSALRDVPGVGPKLAERIAGARDEFDADGRAGALPAGGGHGSIARGDPALSAAARGDPRPAAPALRPGDVSSRRDQLAIALVGSRRCTPYGLRIAERLAASLARVGLTVVSGLARGIDAAAHRGALKAGGRTLAVLANGLAEVYPPEHDELAARDRRRRAPSSARCRCARGRSPASSRSATGSSPASAWAWSWSRPRPGAARSRRRTTRWSRTARSSPSPGPVDSLASQGCHRLIRDGARLVETVDDILEELGPLVREVRAAPDEPAGAPPRRADPLRPGALAPRPARRPARRPSTS